MEEKKDVYNIGPTKRKLFEGSLTSDNEKGAKRPKLQVRISRLELSEEQLQKLRKKSANHKNEPLIVSNEDKKKNGAALNTSAAVSSTSKAKTVTAVTTTTEKQPVTTEEESPVRHRLSNLLDGSFLSLYRGSAAEEEEGNVRNINCKGDGQLNNADCLSAPVSAEDNLFCSEELLSFKDVCSPLLQEEDCVTVPCYPDVVSKTCMQVTEAANQTLSDNTSQPACVISTSLQDKEEDHEENPRPQPANDDLVSNLAEEGPVSRSATPDNGDALEQLPGDVLPENKEAENGSAEEGTSAMLKSAEVKDNMIDYASDYNTLEVMNTLLTNLTEEKRARTELEEQVSQLKNENQELIAEREKLMDLVNDLLPSSKVKNETVSRGVQINMDLSLRRGRAVDRATSPLRGMRETSPDIAVLSSTVGCQTVSPLKDVISTECQTDPVVPQRLPARCTTQTAAPARVQGIVMPNIQGRVQGPTSCTQASNPVQAAYSQPVSSILQTKGRQVVARQLDMQSQQGQASMQVMPKQPTSAHHTTQQYPMNMLQAVGYNNATGYQNGTLNVAQGRTSQSTATGQFAQASNQFANITSLLATPMSDNHTLTGSNSSAYAGVHNVGNRTNAVNVSSLSAQQPPQPDKSNQNTGQRLNLNTVTLTQLLAQNQLLAHNSSLSNKTLSPAQSTLYNSRPAQSVATQQQQSTPACASQISANARSAIHDKTIAVLQYINERRRQIAAMQSLRNSQQLLGTSLSSSMAYSQAATPQHTRGIPLQHQVSQSQVSQAAQLHAQTNLASFRNSQQPFGTSLSSNMAYSQVATPHNTGRPPLQHQVSQSQASQATQLHAQPNPASVRDSQQLGTFPPSRMAHNHQVVTQQYKERLPLQHHVLQPDASQAQLNAQPKPASVQQNNVNSMIRQQSGQNLSSTRTSNSNNDLGTRLLENALERRARSHVEAQSLYSEVQLVYNELQKSLNECTSVGKENQRSSSQSPRPLDNQLNQLQASTNPPSNEQRPSSIPVSSISAQRPVHCHTPANQFQLDDTSQVSASQTITEMPHSNGNFSVATEKCSVRFSQETNPCVPMDVASGNKNGSSRLSSSERTDLNSSKQQTSHRFSTDKDPYKVPPKTPSGALEDTVKRLLALQNKITRTEHVSDEGHASSSALAESTDGTSRVANPTESQQSEQELATNGENNLKNPTEDTSISPATEKILNTDLDKRQQVDETASSVLDENKIANENEIKHFPITEGEKQDSAVGDGQENKDRDEADTLATCSPGLNNKSPGEDKQVTDNDDVYIDLMSPIIPRMAAARRVRSNSDVHTTGDVDDVDKSNSRMDVSIQSVDIADHNIENDPELSQSKDKGEQTLEDGQQESDSLCSKGPSADADCNQQEDESGTVRREQEDVVSNQEHVPLSSEGATEEMQLEEDIQASSASTAVRAVDDATKQASCNTKPQGMTSSHLVEEQLATETSDSHGDPPAPVPAVPSTHLKSEPSSGSCMGGIVQMDNKTGKKEQHEKCELNPEAIPKQDFVCLNGTLLETPTVGEIERVKLPSLKLEKGSEQNIPCSLVKRNVDGSNVSRILVDSNKNVEWDKKNTVANSEPSQQPLNTATLPAPRLALRVVNGNTVIMWDLPPENNVTATSFFEVFVYLVNKDGRSWQNNGGQWIKIGQMKSMPLPMACTIRHLIQKKVVYFFIVRAVGHDGVPGPFSKPCCVACS